MTRSKSRFYLTLIFIAFYLTVIADGRSDSLMTVAKDINQDTKNRLTAFSGLVYHFEVSDPEKAIQLGNEAMKLPKVDSLFEELGKLYVNIGFVYYSAQEYEKAIPYFKKAAKTFEEGGNVKEAAVHYSNVGIFNRKLGNYSESIKYQLISLEKFEQIDNLTGQTTVSINIGNIYDYQNQPELALPYFEKAYQLSLLQDDSLLRADAINAYAFGFDHLGEMDTALVYYLEAIDTYAILEKWIKKAKAEHNVAIIYMGMQEYDKAENMLLSSLEVFKQLPSSMDIEKATIQLGLARVYDQTDRHELAIKNFKEVLVVFRSKGVKTEEKLTLGFLSESLAKQGSYQEAFDILKEFIILKDSIQNGEITTEIAEITGKYESEKKEKEILSLQNINEQEARMKWFVASIAIAIISLMIIIFLIYRQRSIKEAEKNKNRLEQNARELDILRQKIAKGTTQYTVPYEFNFNREEVNSLLTDDLSDRELDVFMLLLEGHTNKIIGEKLFVSINTIKFHLQNIYVKLDVDNRSDAIKSVSKNEMSEPALN